TGHAFGGPAGARIDDVAKALTIVLEELLFAAAGRQGTVANRQQSHSPILVSRMTQTDRPSAAPTLTAADSPNATCAGIQQRCLNAVISTPAGMAPPLLRRGPRAHQRNHTIERIAFTD